MIHLKESRQTLHWNTNFSKRHQFLKILQCFQASQANQAATESELNGNNKAEFETLIVPRDFFPIVDRDVA